MKENLTLEEQKMLLRIAREAIELAVGGKKLPPLESSTLSPNLREHGASFVTLTIGAGTLTLTIGVCISGTLTIGVGWSGIWTAKCCTDCGSVTLNCGAG